MPPPLRVADDWNFACNQTGFIWLKSHMARLFPSAGALGTWGVGASDACYCRLPDFGEQHLAVWRIGLQGDSYWEEDIVRIAFTGAWRVHSPSELLVCH